MGPFLGGVSRKQLSVLGSWYIKYLDLYPDYLKVSVGQNLLSFTIMYNLFFNETLCVVLWIPFMNTIYFLYM